jgi:hypothetical protein
VLAGAGVLVVVAMWGMSVFGSLAGAGFEDPTATRLGQ